MKRVGYLLILLVMMQAACSSGGTSQLGSEDALDVGTVAPPVSEAEEPASTEAGAEETSPGASSEADDPTQVRDRDWKLGNSVDPAVTVVEYGDFQ